jgi:ATP-binding cassette, subfamily B, bacterial PglK
VLNSLGKVLGLFERRERWQLAGLCAVMALVALVQTVGIATVVPFMNIASDPSLIESNRWLSRIYQLGGFETHRGFLLFTGVVVLGVMAFSNGLAAFEQWLMFRFVWAKQHRLSVRLLSQYLHEPYTFYLANNSAALSKNILFDVLDVVTGVIIPGLRVISQSLVIVFVSVLLFIIEPTVAIAAMVFLGGSYTAIYTSSRRKLDRLGAARLVAHEHRLRAVNEALGSIKEARVLGREEHLLRRFKDVNWGYADISRWNSVMLGAPRYALETLAFGGIILIAVYLIQARDNFGEAVAVMSLYAFAAYRLMPALQQAFRGFAEMRFYIPGVESLHEARVRREQRGEKATPAPVVLQPLDFQHDIVLEDIGYRYPGTNAPVLDRIRLTIPRHSSVAFVGSTGSGKTTLIDIVLGLLEPQCGKIMVDDVALSADNLPAWRQLLGYVPQHIYLSDDSIRRNIAFGLPDSAIDFAAVQRAARIANLHDFIIGLPNGYETEIGDHGVRLSGGQRQRIGIARALYRDPEVLVMDEATSALDGVTEEAVIQAIQQISKSKTMLIVAHRLTTVKDCDVIYLLERGQVVASGTYHELMRTNLTFRSMAKGAAEEQPVF